MDAPGVEEVSGVGKGSSSLTNAHAEQDLELARGAGSRTRMSDRLRPLVDAKCPENVVCSDDDGREDLTFEEKFNNMFIGRTAAEDDAGPGFHDRVATYSPAGWDVRNSWMRHVDSSAMWASLTDEEREDYQRLTGNTEPCRLAGPMPEDK